LGEPLHLSLTGQIPKRLIDIKDMLRAKSNMTKSYSLSAADLHGWFHSTIRLPGAPATLENDMKIRNTYAIALATVGLISASPVLAAVSTNGSPILLAQATTQKPATGTGAQTAVPDADARQMGAHMEEMGKHMAEMGKKMEKKGMQMRKTGNAAGIDKDKMGMGMDAMGMDMDKMDKTMEPGDM